VVKLSDSLKTGVIMGVKALFKVLVLSILYLLLIVDCSKPKSEQELFKQADKALAEGKFNDAIKAYKDIIRFFPKSPESGKAQFLMGITYLDKLNDSTNTEGSFKKLLKDYPDFDLERKLYDQAQDAQSNNRSELAIKIYEQILTLFPQSPNDYKAQFLIGFVYSEQLEDHQKAKEAYRKVVEKYPNSDLADDAEFMMKTLEADSLPRELK
jgi:outer membrane protein assembly factor BamD (BamD/ComL family)